MAEALSQYTTKTLEFFKKIVKGSPNFVQAAWDRRIANREVRKRQLEMLKQEQANKPKCPICGSTSISKISTLNRAVSVSLLGLASSKIGKTQKCNKCGSTW